MEHSEKPYYELNKFYKLTDYDLIKINGYSFDKSIDYGLIKMNRYSFDEDYYYHLHA